MGRKGGRGHNGRAPVSKGDGETKYYIFPAVKNPGSDRQMEMEKCGVKAEGGYLGKETYSGTERRERVAGQM